LLLMLAEADQSKRGALSLANSDVASVSRGTHNRKRSKQLRILNFE
jgi:hypothetical protein